MGFEIDHESEDFPIITPTSGKGQLAMGLRVPTSVKTPVSYLDNVRSFKDLYNDIHQQIQVCNKIYRYTGIVGEAVDVLIDFAVTRVYPEPTGNKRFDLVLEHFFEQINKETPYSLHGMHPIMEQLCLEWFTSGNAFPYVRWANTPVRGTTYKLPALITLINPESIKIPSNLVALGQKAIYLQYDESLINLLSQDGRSNPDAAIVKSMIPRATVESLLSNSNSGLDGIRLNPKFVTHLARRKKDYQGWGVPYLSRLFSDIALLERLRALDESISEGLINLVTIFKVGTEDHPASQARLNKFAALIRNSKANHVLVWAHDIDVQQVGPDGKILNFAAKTKDAKENLLIGLGIPPTLMASSQARGDAWVSILALVERLSQWRKTITLWLENICSQIAEANGFSQTVKVKWDRMNLVDEKSVKNLILAFYDRGLISKHTSLKDGNYDYDKEKGLKEDEKPDEKLFEPPDLPFSSTTETSKQRPEDTSIKKKPKKPTSETKTDQTVDLKTQKKKAIPGGK